MTQTVLPVHLSPLGFRIVRTPLPKSSGMTGEVVQKVRDDGRIGPAVGDETRLWDALQEARQKFDGVLQALKEETGARLDAVSELEALRRLYYDKEREANSYRVELGQLKERLSEAEKAAAALAGERDSLLAQVGELSARVAAQGDVPTERPEQKGRSKR